MMTTLPKRIVLLYNGYPRLSQTYQIDEAEELIRRGHTIMIVSWAWELYIISETAPPALHVRNPLLAGPLSKIAAFQPDIIHAHFLTNVDVCIQLSNALGGVPFTIRTHSFDVLGIGAEHFQTSVKRLSDAATSGAFRGAIIFPSYRERFLAAGAFPEKLIVSYPSISVQSFLDAGSTDAAAQASASWPPTHIMSGGAFLPKKNIAGFIAIAQKIHETYPACKISYYSVKEDTVYYEKIMALNRAAGNPVIFRTVPHEQMPAEYVRHQWLIYDACPTLKTVGCPLMIAEAQAAGVGVLAYNLRPEMADYVTDAGFMYDTPEDIIRLIKRPFDATRRAAARALAAERYDIRKNIADLEAAWA